MSPTCRCGRRSPAGRGRLISPCGVCTLMPEQQPQRQSDVPVQLTCSSLSSLHAQRQLAVIGKAGIVVEAGNLEWAKRNFALGEENRSRRRCLRLEHRCDHALHARNFARGRVDRAQVDSLSEGEVVGREKPLVPSGKIRLPSTPSAPWRHRCGSKPDRRRRSARSATRRTAAVPVRCPDLPTDSD